MRPTTAYNTYGIGRTKTRDIGQGRLFQAREARRYQGQVWIKSSLGDWVNFQSGNLFEGTARCGHGGAKVWLSPSHPEGNFLYDISAPGLYFACWHTGNPSGWAPDYIAYL